MLVFFDGQFAVLAQLTLPANRIIHGGNAAPLRELSQDGSNAFALLGVVAVFLYDGNLHSNRLCGFRATARPVDAIAF